MFSIHSQRALGLSRQRPQTSGSSSTRQVELTQLRVSFIFIVNELATNEEPSEGGVRPRSTPYWLPPTDSRAYSIGQIGRIYRWRNGEVEALPDHQWQPFPPGRDGVEGARGSVVHPNGLLLELYRAATVFYSNPFTHFSTARGDATIRDTARADPEDQWQRLTFHASPEGEPTVSYVSHAGEYDTLLAPGRHLVPQLLPEAYDYQPHSDDSGSAGRVDSATGLSGDLAIIIALVAFSCRPHDLDNILTTDRAWRRGAWRGHPRPHGRQPRRGVSIGVYLDPDNEDGSNYDVLNMFESGRVPIFRGA